MSVARIDQARRSWTQWRNGYVASRSGDHAGGWRPGPPRCPPNPPPAPPPGTMEVSMKANKLIHSICRGAGKSFAAQSGVTLRNPGLGTVAALGHGCFVKNFLFVAPAEGPCDLSSPWVKRFGWAPLTGVDVVALSLWQHSEGRTPLSRGCQLPQVNSAQRSATPKVGRESPLRHFL